MHCDAAGTLLRASRPPRPSTPPSPSGQASQERAEARMAKSGLRLTLWASWLQSPARLATRRLPAARRRGSGSRASSDIRPRAGHRFGRGVRRGAGAPTPASAVWARAVQFAHPAPGATLARADVTEFSAAAPIRLAKCGRSDFQVVHTAPVLANGWVVLGEVSKWVPVSPDRITSIDAPPAAASLCCSSRAPRKSRSAFIPEPCVGAGHRQVCAACIGRSARHPAGTCA